MSVGQVTVCTLKPDLDMDGNADDGMFDCVIKGTWKGGGRADWRMIGWNLWPRRDGGRVSE